MYIARYVRCISPVQLAVDSNAGDIGHKRGFNDEIRIYWGDSVGYKCPESRKIVYILAVIRRLNFYIGGSYRTELRRCSKF